MEPVPLHDLHRLLGLQVTVDSGGVGNSYSCDLSFSEFPGSSAFFEIQCYQLMLTLFEPANSSVQVVGGRGRDVGGTRE